MKQHGKTRRRHNCSKALLCLPSRCHDYVFTDQGWGFRRATLEDVGISTESAQMVAAGFEKKKARLRDVLGRIGKDSRDPSPLPVSPDPLPSLLTRRKLAAANDATPPYLLDRVGRAGSGGGGLATGLSHQVEHHGQR